MPAPAKMIKCIQCGKEFALQAEAPHKKFHNAKCRFDWHSARRREAMRQLQDREAAAGDIEGAAQDLLKKAAE